jgi:hypothetical protein
LVLLCFEEKEVSDLNKSRSLRSPNDLNDLLLVISN